MSVYEDVKKAIQEFLAPELAALKERVDQNEKRAQERHQALNEKLDYRFKNLEEKMELRFDNLTTLLELHKRLESLEREREERKAN